MTLFFLAPLLLAGLPAGDWAQFRGPNASGAVEEGGYPDRLGRDVNVIWETPLPPGISSPSVGGDRIHLTAESGGKLLTLALDRATGRKLWERAAPAARLEEVHGIGSPATPTPASSEGRVHVFFGSFGLVTYGREGETLWELPLGPFKNNYGQASSPVVAGDLVILNCDQDVGSFLLAVDRKTGKPAWRTERPGFPRGFSTPILFGAREDLQVLVAGTLRLIAYRVKDGSEVWSARGLARIVNSTPVLGQDLIYVSSYAPGGDPDERIRMEPFAEFARMHDANRDGLIAPEEVPEGPFRSRYPQIDADKDGKITPDEWESMARIFASARNSIFALRPGGRGDVTDSGLAWRHERAIPYVPSPLLHRGLIYLVKDGGIITCLDAATGKVLGQGRLPGAGNYYASPVAAGDHIYTVNRDGVACVLREGKDCTVLHSAELGETCMATPALAGGRVYLRTEKRLYCFGAAF